jgi:sialate O-acetylesterase
VQSLRTLFNSPSAHAAIVQLAPWASSAAALNRQVAALREAQLEAADAPGMSVVTAVDLGDPYGPIGSIHPRQKKPVGQRLGNALLSHVYGQANAYAGPRLAHARAGGGGAGGISATLDFVLPSGSAAPLQLLPPSPSGPFANSSACPVGVAGALCSGFQLQGATTGAWYAATAEVAAGGLALVLQAAQAQGEAGAAAAASGWSLWPITLLYSQGDMLPAFPFNATVQG